MALLHSVSYFFFLYQSPSLSLCMVFDTISSNVDEVLSINPSANVFVFGNFNAHHKDWLTYSLGTDRSSDLWNGLTQMINFLSGPILESKACMWAFKKGHKSGKVLKIWAKMYKIWKYFENRLGDCVIIACNKLLEWVLSVLTFPECDYHNLLIWICLFLLMLVFVL